MVFVALVRSVGKGFLLAATTAFLVGVSLFLVASYMLTWPILRKSPRERKLAAAAELASATFTLLGTLGGNPVVTRDNRDDDDASAPL